MVQYKSYSKQLTIIYLLDNKHTASYITLVLFKFYIVNYGFSKL